MLSMPSAVMPAKKHHVAADGFLRTTLKPASSRLKIPATNGSCKKTFIAPGVSASTTTGTTVPGTARKRSGRPGDE